MIRLIYSGRPLLDNLRSTRQLAPSYREAMYDAQNVYIWHYLEWNQTYHWLTDSDAKDLREAYLAGGEL